MTVNELIERLSRLPEEEREKAVVDDCQYEVIYVMIGWNNQVMLGTHISEDYLSKLAGIIIFE